MGLLFVFFHFFQLIWFKKGVSYDDLWEPSLTSQKQIDRESWGKRIQSDYIHVPPSPATTLQGRSFLRVCVSWSRRRTPFAHWKSWTQRCQSKLGNYIYSYINITLLYIFTQCVHTYVYIYIYTCTYINMHIKSYKYIHILDISLWRWHPWDSSWHLKVCQQQPPP